MRKLVLAAALLASTAITANAAVVATLGVNPTSRTGDFASGLLGINGTGSGAFTDQVTFSVLGTQLLTIASATNVYPNPTDFITNFTAQGFRIVGAIGGGDDIPVTPLISAVACPLQSNCQGFAGSTLLDTGSYYLQLAGVGGGSSGYGGNLAVTQVPIPAVGAGLPGVLAAFSLLGWCAKRRRNKLAA